MTPADLRAARKQAGLTQAQLASRWGISKRTVGRWEMGDELPGWIADAVLGLKVEAAGLRITHVLP